MEYLIWAWIAVLAASVVCEVITKKLISVCFLPGALVAAVLALCKVWWIWQLVTFTAVSVIAFVAVRIFIPKLDRHAPSGIDAIIGERCVVQEKIDNFAGCGLVKIKGQLWSARGVSENDVFEPGQVLSVVAIEGVKLICKKN